MSAEESERKNYVFEIRMAFIIAFFAGILSCIDLAAGKYGDDEIISVNKKMSAYELYHTKVLKETMAEGERNLLEDLLQAGAIIPKDSQAILKSFEKFDKDLQKIKKQQVEIYKGSKNIDKSEWAMPDLKGEYGNIKGIIEWEHLVEQLGIAGDAFDMASLFVELALVLGAMAILAQVRQVKNIFMILVILLGLLGTAYGIYAYTLVMNL